jgi:uncharacterized protein (UPF0548 family)
LRRIIVRKIHDSYNEDTESAYSKGRLPITIVHFDVRAEMTEGTNQFETAYTRLMMPRLT